MNCPNCGAGLNGDGTRCPRCGATQPEAAGVFRSSTVLISAGEADQVYRSVEEVPAPLRTQLLNSTNGANSATILIADRRGRQEIARALGNLSGPAQQRLARSILGDSAEPAKARIRRRKIAGLIVAAALLLLVLAGLAFVRYWA